MITRRAFTMGVASSYFLTGSSPGISLGCQTNAWPVDPINFDSLLTVLGKTRKLGFAGIETGIRSLQSETEHSDSARRKIASSGLQFFGVHIFLLQYDEKTHIAPAELCEGLSN
jgi:inosose dehydratase